RAHRVLLELERTAFRLEGLRREAPGGGPGAVGVRVDEARAPTAFASGGAFRLLEERPRLSVDIHVLDSAVRRPLDGRRAFVDQVSVFVRKLEELAEA